MKMFRGTSKIIRAKFKKIFDALGTIGGNKTEDGHHTATS